MIYINVYWFWSLINKTFVTLNASKLVCLETPYKAQARLTGDEGSVETSMAKRAFEDILLYSGRKKSSMHVPMPLLA